DGTARGWLRGEVLDGGDAAEAVGEALQEGEAVAADGGVVGVDHHLVEERVHLRAQAREPAEYRDVVALLERGGGGGGGGVHGLGEFALGVLGEQLRVDLLRDRALGLAQDVADALVGGGERLGFRQQRELGDRLQAAVEVGQGQSCRSGARAAIAVGSRRERRSYS